jgi:hypothetical protein
MIYSGSLRCYTNLPTARYDMASGQELIDGIRAVQKAGGPVYLLLDKWEHERMFKTEASILFNYARLNDSFSDPEKVWLFELNVPLESERK